MDNNWRSGAKVAVRAALDGLKDGTQERTLRVTAQWIVNTQTVSVVSVAHIHVEIEDRDKTSECGVFGDPHLKTFDKKRYNNFLEGEFVFYKHKTDPYEVRTFFRRCNEITKAASCVCAVAVKSDDDVIVFDKCGAGRGETTANRPITVSMYINGELTPGTSVLRLRGGKKFRVLLPTGGYVTVETGILKGKYLNVYMRGSPRDRGMTEGLCGSMDGERDNDVNMELDAFNEHWRVEDKDSLYTGYCAVAADNATVGQVWCMCTESGELCGTNAPSQSCANAPRRRRSRSPGKDITQDLILTSSQNPPQRCLTRQPPTVVFEYEITYVAEIPAWPTTGLTYVNAATECRTQIEAQLNLGKCGAITAVSAQLTSAIDTCIEDVQITGQLSWAESALGNLLQVCVTSVEFNIELWTSITVNGSTVVSPPLDVLDSILCANNCSNHGQCEEGTCKCEENFSGDDCSDDLTMAPVIVIIPTPRDVCDTRESPCLQVTVYGSGFVTSTDLVCFVQLLEISGSGFAVNSTELAEVPAVFITGQEVVCQLTAVGVYNVSVTNVRSTTIRSTAITHIAYDSSCYACTAQGCTTNADVCVIDGQCYADGFVDPNNPGQRCANGATQWTIIEKTEVVSTTYIFIQIIQNILITSSANLTVEGKPALVDGPTGKAIELNGVDQFVNLTSTTDACIFSPASCRLGLSAAFSLKVLEVKEDMYIFTSGGDSVEGQGVAMYYRRGSFFLTISTKDREWTVSVTQSVLKVNIFVSVEFSWSVQTGLQLLLDGEVVAETKTYIRRRVVNATAFSTFCLGRSLGLQSTVFSRIVIEGWTLSLCTRQTREAVLPEDTTTVATTTELPTTQTFNTTEMDNATVSKTTTVAPDFNTTETDNTTDSETTMVTPVSNTMETVSNTMEAANATTAVTPVLNTTKTENATDTTTSATPSFNTTKMDNTNVTTEETTSTTTAPQATTCLGTENSFPVIPVPPTVTNAVLSGGVRFDCQLQAAEAGSIYYVTWSSSGTVLRNETLTGGDLLDSFDTTGLPESTRSSIITSGVTCSVRASNPARCGDGVSPAVSITLDLTKLSVTRPTQSVLQAATETSLTVSFKNQVTPEFYCALMYGQTCVVLVEVQTSQETPWKCIGGDPIEALSVRSLTTPTSGAGDVCGTHLSSVSSQQVMLRPSVDNIVRSAVNVTVDVRQVDVVGQQRVNTELLDVITLTVEGSMETVSSCRVYADPHVVTFDGLTYDVMRPGRFLVYKHKELDLEVEGYFFTTGNGASACGFGIRSGDDVIRVSRCGSPMSTKVFLVGGQLTAHTKVYQEEEGNKIKVFLPTGTVVIVTGSYSDIDTGDSGMVHLEIRPSALDFGQTQGLCGTYDGDSSNDLTSRFGQVFTLNPDKDPNDFTGTWAVAESDSLFGGFQGRATSSFTDTYCSCQRNTAPVCADFGFVAECGVSFAGTDITQTLVEDYQLNQGLQQTQQTQTNTARRRRQTTSNTREVFTFDPNFTDPANATWPTAKGITEGQAKQRCENAIVTSPVYSTCSQFSADNFTTEINSCVRDIQLMDDLAWVDAAVQTIQERCGTDIAVNSSLWQDPNPTSASVTPTLATILQSLCPNQCSGFGSCNDGTCDCIPGYGGTDCSFKVSLAPTVASQASHALCQSDVAACNRTFVRGEHFMENVGELSCHLTPIEVGETGITSRGATLLSAATYRSQYEVLCALPEPRSYAIKVSNDKQSTSLHEALFVVYNPKCFDCQLDASSPTCTPKSLTCLIDGQCYNNGETDPTDSCRVCSLASYDSWSTNSVAGCQSTTLSTTTTEGRGNDRSSRFNEETTIIGASLASVIVVLAIIGITVYVIRRRQRRRTQRELVSRSSDHSSYERNYDGSFGVRTQKSLAFKNPTQMHYESTLDH